MFALIVANRIEAILPQPCSNFILAAKSTDPKSAYKSDKIANMVDVYFATHSYDGRKKVAGNYASRSVNKQSSSGEVKPRGNVHGDTSQTRSIMVAGMPTIKASLPAAAAEPSRIRSFARNQFGHTRFFCQCMQATTDIKITYI